MKIDEEMLKRLSVEITQQFKRNLDPDSTGKDPNLTGNDPDSVRKDPDLTRKDPDLTRRDQDLTRHNPDVTRITTDSARTDPDLTRRVTNSTRTDPDLTLKDPSRNGSGNGGESAERGQSSRRGKMLNMEMKFVQDGGILSDLATTTDWLKTIPAASSKSSESLEEKVKVRLLDKTSILRRRNKLECSTLKTFFSGRSNICG
jgi:hypothetical protein